MGIAEKGLKINWDNLSNKTAFNLNREPEWCDLSFFVTLYNLHELQSGKPN